MIQPWHKENLISEVKVMWNDLIENVFAQNLMWGENVLTMELTWSSSCIAQCIQHHILVAPWAACMEQSLVKHLKNDILFLSN